MKCFLVPFLAFSGVLSLVISCTKQEINNEPIASLPSKERADALVAECMVCHSNQEAQRGPVIHGMETWYLLDQLEKFRSGVRGKFASNRSE